MLSINEENGTVEKVQQQHNANETTSHDKTRKESFVREESIDYKEKSKEK